MVEILIILVVAALIFTWHVVIWSFAVGAFLAIVHIPVFGWIKAHPLLLVSYIAAYFLVGAAWSVIKWWFAETERVRKSKEDFANRSFKKPDDLLQKWLDNAKTNPVRYKGSIIEWITFWPFSAVYTLLNDPVRRLCRRIYHELQQVYQSITDHVWKA